MVPLTIFTTYGIVTELTGGRTAGACIVTLVAMLFTAASYSFMVKRFPVAGSAYSYTTMAFGPNAGFLAGWSLLLDYLFLPMINYLLIGLFLNIAFPAIPAWSIALASIALVTVLNVVGIHSVAKTSNLIVGAQIIFIVAFVALSCQSLAAQPLDLLSPLLGDDCKPGFGPIMTGAAVLCLSLLGFDAVSTLAEEYRDARRDVPRAGSSWPTSSLLRMWPAAWARRWPRRRRCRAFCSPWAVTRCCRSALSATCHRVLARRCSPYCWFRRSRCWRWQSTWRPLPR